MLPINDKKRVFLGNNIPKEYFKDDYLKEINQAHALVKVMNENEVISLVKYSHENDLGIIAIGANTGLSGATHITGNEILIDLSLMNKIHGLDEDTMTLTLEPGVTLEEIQHYVESRHFFYPPDPGSKNSTIGGNIATNAGGMRAVKYGVTRDYVRAIDVILADGTKLNLGSLNIKDSSGYDLKDLFIGSEGTLGITTLIKLKVIPLPKFKRSYIAAFENLVKATESVSTLLHRGIDPTAVEFFERDMISMTEHDTGITLPTRKGQSFLLFTLDGDSIEHIDARAQLLKTALLEHECVEFLELSDPQLEKDVWHLRDSLLKSVVSYSEQVTMDETVPLNEIATIYAYTKELEEEYNVKLMSFGHAGDGNLHTCIIRGDIQSDEEWNNKKDIILEKLYQRIHDLGGLPSAEHGIGMIKQDHFYQVMDPHYLEFMKKIKDVFDPKGHMNPHKVMR